MSIRNIRGIHIILPLFGAFTWFVFAPIELYITIKDDVWFGIFDFLTYILLCFCGVFLILIFLEFILFKTGPVLKLLNSIAFWMTVSLYIQGNFLRFDYGLLNGHQIEWENYRKEGAISLALFVVVIVVGMLLHFKVKEEKYNKAIMTISVCMILMQASTLLIGGNSCDLFEKKVNTVSTKENEFVFSKNDNIVVFVLDSFDYRVFDSLLKGNDGAYVRDSFKDFTYYSDTVSLYEMTDYSVPQILTGCEYLCAEPYEDYVEHVYNESYLLGKLKEKQYDIGIYSTIDLPKESVGVTNWRQTKSRVSSHVKLLKDIYKLIGYRYMPQQLKRYFWFYPDEIDELRVIEYTDPGIEYSGDDIFKWANNELRDDLYSSDIELIESPGSFHMYHIKGLHPKRNMDRFYNVSDTEISFEETGLGVIDLLNVFFERMREKGIYESSSIMIMADHGDSEYLHDQLSNLALFMFKGANEEHDLMMNEDPFSYAELNAFYADMLEDDRVFDSTDRYLYKIIWSDQATDAKNHVAGFDKVYISGDSSVYDNYKYVDEKYLIK